MNAVATDYDVMRRAQRVYIDAYSAWARAYFDALCAPTKENTKRLMVARDAYDEANEAYRWAVHKATGRRVS
jgi:hypothetical protein